MKKYYKNFVIALSIFAGLCWVYTSFSNPRIRMEIFDPVNNQDYETLEKKAINYAQSFNSKQLDNEITSAEYSIKENQLVVKIASKKLETIVKLPLKNYTSNNNGKIIETTGEIDFDNDNIEIETSILLDDTWWVIFMFFVGLAFLTLGVYYALYGVWVPRDNIK